MTTFYTPIVGGNPTGANYVIKKHLRRGLWNVGHVYIYCSDYIVLE